MLIARDTVDQDYAQNRQRFLAEQGYSYTILGHPATCSRRRSRLERIAQRQGRYDSESKPHHTSSSGVVTTAVFRALRHTISHRMAEVTIRDISHARILVVDDEPNIRDLLSTGLSFGGYQVKTVSNGAATISAVLEEEPDLIILDVMLPDMNGFSVTKRLRGAGFTAPILFLTAKDDTQDKIEGLNAGGDDYVTKPFALDEIVARVQAILRRTNTPMRN